MTETVRRNWLAAVALSALLAIGAVAGIVGAGDHGGTRIPSAEPCPGCIGHTGGSRSLPAN